MIQTLTVKLNERAVIFRDGLPVRSLSPGRYTLWLRKYQVQRFNTQDLLLRALPEVRDVLPDGWFSEVSLNSRQRGVLMRDGLPTAFLRPGVHRYWTVDASVKLVVLSVDDAMPELTDELVAILPRKEYVVAVVEEYQRGLEFVQGRFTRELSPGRHTYWTYPEAQVRVDLVDMRQQQLNLAGQELLTRDKVTLRLSLSAEFAVVDAYKSSQQSISARDALYLMVQLAARDYLASVRLDELLEGRDEMSQILFEKVGMQAAALGLRVERVGVKDIVLPGDMRALLNRVIEAEKEAAANVILRREETAATRSLANTARVMADHPVLLRLKELEAIKDIAERIDNVRLVLGSEGLGKLLPGELLSDQLEQS